MYCRRIGERLILARGENWFLIEAEYLLMLPSMDITIWKKEEKEK